MIEQIKTVKVRYEGLGEVVFPLRMEVPVNDKIWERILQFKDRERRIKGSYDIYANLYDEPNFVGISLGVSFFVNTELVTKIFDKTTMKNNNKRLAVQKMLMFLSSLKKNEYAKKIKEKMEKIVEDPNVDIRLWYDDKKDEFGEKMYIYDLDLYLTRGLLYFVVNIELEIHKYVTEVNLYFYESIKDRNLAKFSFKKIKKPYILPQEFLALFWSLDRYIMSKFYKNEEDEDLSLINWLFSPLVRSTSKRHLLTS